MKYLIPIFLFLSACSAEYHLGKAIKKDPTIQKEIVDTLRIKHTYLDTIHTSDSTYYIERKIVHYDTIIKYTKVQADFSEMKTWWETVQENKTERTKIRNERKTNRTHLRHKYKTDRTSIRQTQRTERRGSLWWLWLIIGAVIIIIGKFALTFLTGYLKK